MFPNNFKEVEDLKVGGFNIVEDGRLKWEQIQIYNVFTIRIDCSHKIPEQVEQEIEEQIKNKEFNDTIVTIRLSGTLESGKPSDISFKDIFDKLYEKSAYFVMKNTNALTTKEFEEIKIEAGSVEEMEEKLIKEHLGQIKIESLTAEQEEKITKELLGVLSAERDEGEKVADFERRIKEEVSRVLKI